MSNALILSYLLIFNTRAHAQRIHFCNISYLVSNVSIALVVIERRRIELFEKKKKEKKKEREKEKKKEI